MSKMIQVRNVPDEMHKELVRRAKLRGQTLSDYIEALLERDVALPPRETVFEEVHRMPRVKLDRPVAEYLRDEREERESRSEK